MGNRFRDFGLLFFSHKFVYKRVFCNTECAHSVKSYKNVCLLKSVISDSDFKFGYNSKDCYKKKSTFEAVLSKRKCSFVYCFLGKYIKLSV